MLALPALGEVLMVTSHLHPARDLPSTPHPRTEPEIQDPIPKQRRWLWRGARTNHLLLGASRALQSRRSHGVMELLMLCSVVGTGGSTAPTEAPDDATAEHTVLPWGDFPV